MQSLAGDRITSEYRGKSGQEQVRELRDGLCEAERALVALLRAAERKPTVLRAIAGGASRGAPANARPTGATAKPLRRAARHAER